MAAYQQLGDKSENLLYDARLTTFAGAVLSPVNYTEAELQRIARKAREQRSAIDLVFDPQLYYPRGQQGHLKKWSHFPSDVATADLSDEEWWRARAKAVAAVVERLKLTAVCSPAVVPGTFSDDAFAQMVSTARVLNELSARTEASPRVLQTAIVAVAELAENQRALSIASILSSTPCREVYLVLYSDTAPRSELQKDGELLGVLTLIRALERAGLQVFMAFCSSDVVLWKFAGATHCATGKFFNLRRFTKSRFDEPKEGGSQRPYWFEESLMAFLREPDVIRLERDGLLASNGNPFGAEILETLKTPRRTKDEAPAWLGLAWRQYLYWFASIEERLTNGEIDAATLLRDADAAWTAVDRTGIIMSERGNDGSWVRRWQQALQDLTRSAE